VRKEAATTKEYFARIPKQVPWGRIIVHNHIQPQAPLRRNGFRAWSDLPEPKYVECYCGWAPHLGRHYRVSRTAG
jgi:hypothetical protein